MYFRDVIGLKDVKKHLIESVQNGFVPHARLFYGQEGVGKLPLAIAYARYLNCNNRTDDDACGKCPSCLKIDKFAHPDLHFVFPVIKSKICDEYLPDWRTFLSNNKYFNLNDWLSSINAENAQGLIYSKESEEIIHKLSLKVYEAKYKIMIIWLPEKMHESCANKLLKQIEEPPQNTIFLLVVENPEEVLPTIRSRCQPLNIRAIGREEMVSAIQYHYGIEESDAQTIAHISNGSFTNAIKIIQSENDQSYLLSLFQDMMRASYSKKIKTIREIANKISQIGREMQKNFLLYSMRLFREYFVYNLNEPEIVYLNREESLFGERFAIYINEHNIQELNDEFSLAYKQIEQNGNAKIIFLDLCLKITMLLIIPTDK